MLSVAGIGNQSPVSLHTGCWTGSDYEDNLVLAELQGGGLTGKCMVYLLMILFNSFQQI